MVQSVIAEKLRQQDLEAADHLTSTKKENRDECLLMLSLLSVPYSVQDPLPRKWSKLN